MARAIDADEFERELSYDMALHGEQLSGDAAYNRALVILTQMPTLTPPNEPLTCTGCMYSPDCPSEIHCFGCARLYTDNYRRPPEGEDA